MPPFVHTPDFETSTLSEMRKLYEAIKPKSFFGCYAYATQSGFRSFDLAFGSEFWKETASRWLFGIDYGRTDPRAIREILNQHNTDVRIFDGEWVVAQTDFLPRRDFHAKAAILSDGVAKAKGIVLGSGNFSWSGLIKNVEAGAVLQEKTKNNKNTLNQFEEQFNKYWQLSTPAADILELYEDRFTDKKVYSRKNKPKVPKRGGRPFWIEAGYVTKNRGTDKPGNQIFFPKGFRSYFGFSNDADVEKNAIIGEVNFVTAVGQPVTNNLRLNRNSMEKISLPMPETHGFGVYDGKVLVFQPDNGAFLMSALEWSDFESVFGDRLINVESMSGGRRYGEIRDE